MAVNRELKQMSSSQNNYQKILQQVVTLLRKDERLDHNKLQNHPFHYLALDHLNKILKEDPSLHPKELIFLNQIAYLIEKYLIEKKVEITLSSTRESFLKREDKNFHFYNTGMPSPLFVAEACLAAYDANARKKLADLLFIKSFSTPIKHPYEIYLLKLTGIEKLLEFPLSQNPNYFYSYQEQDESFKKAEIKIAAKQTMEIKPPAQAPAKPITELATKQKTADGKLPAQEPPQPKLAGEQKITPQEKQGKDFIQSLQERALANDEPALLVLGSLIIIKSLKKSSKGTSEIESLFSSKESFIKLLSDENIQKQLEDRLPKGLQLLKKINSPFRKTFASLILNAVEKQLRKPASSPPTSTASKIVITRAR